MTPSLTIGIPVFERIFGFEEALQSAISVPECKEILVVDDVSSHDEFKVLSYATGDPRVRYVRNAKNLGLFGNWNECAKLASGDFIAILCSDDLISPDIYKWFQDAYIQLPELDVFFGAFAVFKTNLSKVGIGRSYPTGPFSSLKLLEEAVDRDPVFPVLSVIKRIKLLEFPFTSQPHSGNDFLWIYSNASLFTLYVDSRPLSFWRRHPDQDSRSSHSITTDCWPLMYTEISRQLSVLGSKKARRADQRAIGVILSWLLNDKIKNGSWHKRLTGPETVSNAFLAKARQIADQNWLLSGLLKSNGMWPLYFNAGRICRKLKIYPTNLKSYS